MPAYNCGKYIESSVKSILNQTFKDFELIIIDDGSTDNTAEKVKSFNDSRIKYYRTENKGTSAALNYGLSLCKNEWVARIDADDLSVPRRLEIQIRFIEGNPEYDVVSSWSVYFREPDKILFLLKEPTEHLDIYDYFDLHNPINSSGLTYRKDIILKECYNETFKYNEDYELFYRIRDKIKFYNIPQFLVYTRVREDSKSYQNNNSNLYEMLFNPAFKNMIDAKSKGDHFYWATNIAWINYFYGRRQDSRSYFKNSFSWKNLTAYITTFLPDEYFHKFINSRLRYRFNSFFKSTGHYKKELRELLK
jgi:glycosyltransferase involved in cell wall biosynthesis